MNRLSKILIIPLLIVMIFAFGMSAFAELHTKWVAGDQIYFDSANIWAFRDDEDGVKLYDDLDLTFGTDNDATIEYDEDGTNRLILTCSDGFTFDGAIWIGTDASPVTLVNDVHEFAVHSAITGHNVGWFNAIEFDTELGTGCAISGTAQLVGVQAYVRLATGAIWSSNGGACGLSSIYIGVGTNTVSDGIHSGLGAMVRTAAGYTLTQTAELCALVVGNQVNASADIATGKFSGILIQTSGAYEEYDQAIKIAATADVGIDFMDWCTTAIDIGDCTYGIHFTGTCGTAAIDVGANTIEFFDSAVNIAGPTNGDMVINADATLIMTSPLTEIVAITSLIHRFDSGDYVTYTIADNGAAKVEVTGAVSGTYEIETSHGAIVLDATATITLDAGTGDIETADVFNSTSAIASTSTASGSIQTDGGVGIVGDVFIGGFINVNASAAETLLDFVLETDWTSGTLIRADFAGGPTTLLGAVTGFALDLGANVDAASEQNVIGIDLNLPQLTINNASVDVIGIEITAEGAMALTVGGDATWVGVNITTPAISESVGTVDTRGINVVGGAISSGTAYGLTFSGEFTTGIDMTGTYATAAINIATISDGVIATISSATTATNALYGRIVADAEWTGNLVGVRGKVEIGSIVDITSATGVWAGIAITGPSIQRHGLVCAINAEVSSTTVNMPNAILYLQSLPSGAAADFSNVPYITFSEYISAGTGSNILFEVGSKYANLMPTIGTGELFYNDTLQIAVNEQAGVRSTFFIPLSNAEGTYSVGTMANATGSGQTITDSYNKMLQIYCDATADGSTVGQAANELYVGEVRQLLTGSPFQGEQYAWKATQRYYGTPAISSYSAAIHGKLESAGTLDVNGWVGCFQAHISDVQAGTFDIDAGGYLYGFNAIGNFGNAHDGSGKSAAYMTSVVAAHNWDVGFLVLDDSTDTGIDIGTTSVAGIDVTNGGLVGIDFNGTFTGNVIQVGDASTALTTATSGLKGIYLQIEFTGTTGNIAGVYSKLDMDWAGSGGVTSQAIYGVVMADSTFDAEAYPAGVRGQMHFATDSAIDNASSVHAGVVAVMTSAGTPTFTSGRICALYVDNQVTQDLSGANVESSLIRMANNDSQLSGIKYGIDFYGPSVTYFMRFEGCTTGGMVWAHVADETSTGRIKIDVDGAVRYLYYYD